MDAHVFRSLSRELGPELEGRRIEKIYSPAKGYWTLVLGARGGKRLLLFHPAKKGGLLLLGGSKPRNPQTAPAQAMWFRKRLSGRWLMRWLVDWPRLRLAWELSPGAPAATGQPREGRFLVLDMHAGMLLADELEPTFGTEPTWPDLERALGDPDIWKDYPHISPALRKRLKALPRQEAQDLYAALAKALPGPVYVTCRDQAPMAMSAWPPDDGPGLTIKKFDSAVQAATVHGEPAFFAGLEMHESSEDRQQLKVRQRRVRRGLERLAADRQRLERMAALQAQAEVLQADLYKHKHGPTPERIMGSHPQHGPLTVELNTRLSVTENMERLFRQAAKGRRGLVMVERRQAQLEAGRLDSDTRPGQDDAPPGQAPAARADDRPFLSKRLRGLAVAVFTTSDGFRVVRAKNQAAGHKLLGQAASPFDLWFHAAHRPGAHVVLKRDHPGQEVPEQSLRQAAVLAGLASGYAGEAKADVFCALVKDVRKIKGAALGLVRVDEVRQTLRVDLDPALPERLQGPLPS